ncbi:MAG: membrane protein YdbS with pleckstrin-like domain [Saprospiraceae bacterium]|jgi:membrane protein YdbS with pleckstrin-like domain
MFLNNQVYPYELPSIRDIQYQSLEKEYLNAEIISQGILWLILLIVAFGTSFIHEEDAPQWVKYILSTIVGLLAIFSFAMTYLGFKYKKYALRERDIIYSSGVLWRSNVVIPFNRVQHAEVSQGPLDRLFNLSSLKIYTAGGSSSDLAIPGLQPSEAERIKYFILNRTASDEEE